MSSTATQGSLQIVLHQNIARQIVSIQGWKEVGGSSRAPLHETLNKLTAVEPVYVLRQPSLHCWSQFALILHVQNDQPTVCSGQNTANSDHYRYSPLSVLGNHSNQLHTTNLSASHLPGIPHCTHVAPC